MRDGSATITGVLKALRFGALVAAGIGAVAFVFGLLSEGLSLAGGLDWARRVLYVVGALCLIVGGAGLFFSGSPLRDARAGVKKDETLQSFEHALGISWATAVTVAAADFFVLGTLVELLFFAIAH